MNDPLPTLQTLLLLLLIVWPGRPRAADAADGPVQRDECPGLNGPCVLKCCGPNETFADDYPKCLPDTREPSKRHLQIPKYVNASGTFGTYKSDDFYLVFKKPLCYNESDLVFMNPIEYDEDNFYINKTGYLLNGTGSFIFSPGSFCLEISPYTDFKIFPSFCNEPYDSVPMNPIVLGQGVNLINIIGMLLSLPFLIITFFVYVLIEELRTCQGKSLMCYIASLIVAYISFIINQFYTTIIREKTYECVIFAYMQQFFFVASFFWLNAMCFDLWWTFRKLRPTQNRSKEENNLRFIYYSIYSWGCPALLSIFTFWMDTLDMTSMPLPEIGKNDCWIATHEARWLYFYGPIGVILLINLFMFVHTTKTLIQHMKSSKVFRGPESNTNVHREKFMMYLKLFILMGINWLTEIISYQILSGTVLLMTIVDVANVLQGVYIFIIIVCKKSVIKMLNKKLGLQSQRLKSQSTDFSGDTDNGLKTSISNVEL